MTSPPVTKAYHNNSKVSHSSHHHQTSSSPQIVTSMQWIFPIILSVSTIIGIPLSFYPSCPSSLHEGISDVIVGWNSLLHISIYPLIVLTSIMAFVIAHRHDSQLRRLWFYSRMNQPFVGSWCNVLFKPWKNGYNVEGKLFILLVINIFQNTDSSHPKEVVNCLRHIIHGVIYRVEVAPADEAKPRKRRELCASTAQSSNLEESALRIQSLRTNGQSYN